MELPTALQGKPKSKLTLDDCVFLVLRNANARGEWMNFWTISERILGTVNKKYGEPTISASIRNMRKEHCREAYELPKYGEVILKRRMFNSKGYEYKLILKGE
jgi:predicted metal-dependent hydrolase